MTAATLQALLARGRPQALLFDLDGTLVDSVPDIAVAIDRMLVSLQLPAAGEARVRNWVGNGAQKLVQRALAYGYDEPENAVTWARLSEAHQRYSDFYRENLAVHTRCYDGVVPALQQLHAGNMALAVVTNKPEAFAVGLLGELGLLPLFACVIGGDTVSERKPAAAPLLEAARRLNADAARCWMVGDSKTDIHAARNANMPVVAVPYGYNHGEDVRAFAPDAIIDSLGVVPAALGLALG
jgi:phosphoglycolate phosphatase